MMGQLVLAALLASPVVLLVGSVYIKEFLDHGRASLHQAARHGDLSAVESFIAAGADVNAESWAGMTPLHYALWFNEDHAIVDALLAAGADVNAKGARFGDTLMYRASSHPIEPHGRGPSVVEFLIAAGADVHARGRDGRTSLHEAVARASVSDEYNDVLSIVSLLLAAGADVNAKSDRFGSTPLHKAALHHTEPHGRGPSVAEILLAAGADVNAKDSDGWVPLHAAASLKGGGLPMVEFLLAAGADVNAETRGVTPLHMAASRRKDLSVINTLLAAGADVNAKNRFGSTPLHYAARWNNEPAVAKALLAAGADVNAKTRRGKTPLDFARKEGNDAAIRVLEAAGAR